MYMREFDDMDKLEQCNDYERICIYKLEQCNECRSNFEVLQLWTYGTTGACLDVVYHIVIIMLVFFVFGVSAIAHVFLLGAIAITVGTFEVAKQKIPN